MFIESFKKQKHFPAKYDANISRMKKLRIAVYTSCIIHTQNIYISINTVYRRLVNFSCFIFTTWQTEIFYGVQLKLRAHANEVSRLCGVGSYG